MQAMNYKRWIISSIGESFEGYCIGLFCSKFGAALASSLNIGCTVNELFDNEHTTENGHLKLNSLILQDDISKMNNNLGKQEIERNA